jgi:hypothetical protein
MNIKFVNNTLFYKNKNCEPRGIHSSVWEVNTFSDKILSKQYSLCGIPLSCPCQGGGFEVFREEKFEILP